MFQNDVINKGQKSGVNIKKVIISPPFGNYVKFNNATCVYGSYTLEKRWGALCKSAKTFRSYKDENGKIIGYVNSIGLKNKGIKNINLDKIGNDSIISLAVIHHYEWEQLAEELLNYTHKDNFIPQAIEINFSCPNVKVDKLDVSILKYFNKFNLIVKLAPLDSIFNNIKEAMEYNVKYFHLCNTLPSIHGGISGSKLKIESLKYIKEVKKLYGDNLNIIGGGGIYDYCDVDDYALAGVNHYSLSTIVWKNPLRVRKLIEYIYTK